MTKNEILDYLLKIDWSDELTNKLEIAVARYVVYQRDPDSDYCYDYKYYLSKDDAEKDFESRDYVASGFWCYCYISSLYENDFRRRTISVSCY